MTEYIMFVASWLQIIAIPFLFIYAIRDTIIHKKFNWTMYIAAIGGLLFVMLSLALQNRIQEIYAKVVEKNEMPTYGENLLMKSILYLPPFTTYFYASYALKHIGG